MKSHVVITKLLYTMLGIFACVSVAQAQIHVTDAEIGCLDIKQNDGNLTGIVGNACNGKFNCSFKAPTPQQYQAEHVQVHGRSFCTQAMHIAYQCAGGQNKAADVPGDAWNHPAAELACEPPQPPPPPGQGIHVVEARIGCLDIQKDANLTGLVGSACNGKSSCSYKAPTPQQYTQAGVHAASRTFCTQAMEITYQCGNGPTRFANVPGDAWNQPPAELACDPPPPPPGSVREPITVTEARIGCLDIQKTGNLTGLVAGACNGRGECSYKAPTPGEYTHAGVQAAGRAFCTQAMEITYRCGQNDPQIVTVPGDAWTHPPADLNCVGNTVATNHQYVTPPVEKCLSPQLGPPNYFIAPSNMLDWTPTQSHGDYTFQGFRPPQPATPAMYNSPPPPRGVTGAPGSTLGANEGRMRAELRAVAAKRDPVVSLCQAAQRFTHNAPASGGNPSDHDFGNAFADLSVTGKASFEKFVQLHPTEATLRGQQACAGASEPAISAALDRAYHVATALRGPHDSPERRALGWIAVSGEDDQPYRPVNVPTNSGHFPEFQIKVTVPKFNIPINTRYMIAHARPPAFSRPSAPLVDGGTRKVPADLLPALANDAEVIVFMHGMDSRLEEADDLTAAMHHLGGHNWTIISVDFPTSGYADNIDHRRISPITEVACHNTPLVDFSEEFIVAFVDTLDAELHGQLKPKIEGFAGGSFGGNIAMRLGRRPNTPWITHVIPWSPAAIWPSMIAQRNAVAAGCDTGWDMLKDRAVNQSLKWAGLEERFLPDHETPELRRELFYGGFDWSPVGGLGGPPQAECWFSKNYDCKQAVILGSRIDRQETYDANFRAWHWRLGAEQLAFSHQQFAPGTQKPLYLSNTKRTLLLSGCDDKCGDLGPDTQDVAKKMVNTPGYARFLQNTGHSLDNEHPDWVARQIADFLSNR